MSPALSLKDAPDPNADGARFRLDRRLVDLGLVRSRSHARELIAAGRVTVDGIAERRPAARTGPERRIEITGGRDIWVSRAAHKLIKGLDEFAVTVDGRTALDLGASTGGFVQVLLSRGAALIHAVDVGHGQLSPELSGSPKIRLHEGINARDLGPHIIPEPIDLITCDVSFIGLRKALPPAMGLAAPGADLVALIKPQFEAGPDRVGKGGIVRDPAVREEIRQDIYAWLDSIPGWAARPPVESPITGSDGNIEYLIAARKNG